VINDNKVTDISVPTSVGNAVKKCGCTLTSRTQWM